jgi:hypothetical protein
MRRKHNDGKRGIEHPQASNQGQPTHIWHLVIGNYQISAALLIDSQGIQTVTNC